MSQTISIERVRALINKHRDNPAHLVVGLEGYLDGCSDVNANIAQADAARAANTTKRGTPAKGPGKRSDGHDLRIPTVGSTFSKVHNGAMHTARVLAEGKLHHVNSGKTYESVSALASDISGRASINGYDFFKLTAQYAEGAPVVSLNASTPTVTPTKPATAPAAPTAPVAAPAPVTPASLTPIEKASELATAGL